MAGLGQLLRRVVKPRRHKRFHAIEGSFVVIGRTAEGKQRIQILDISEGGLAFVYQGPREDLDQEGELSLLAGDALYLDKVTYETVSDVTLSEIPENDEAFRRKGVQFKWLGVLDKAQLKEFIKSNAVG